MFKITKNDSFSLAGLIASVLGVILEIVGVCTTTIEGIGVNLSWNAVTYVGIALIVVGLVVAVYGYEIKEKKETNKIIANVALYVAEAAIVFAILFFALSILNPLLNPTNG